MGMLFGTDGVRGVANKDLTVELAYKLGQAGAYVLTSELNSSPKVLVGMDTRISGDMLKSALVAGLCSVGADAVYLGVVPTPAVAYLVRKYKADAGVVISASHNSYEFNGIKFFNNEGYKLPDEIEDRIESIILNNSEEISLPIGDKLGREIAVETAVDDYVEYIKSTVDGDFKTLKIALDCANGAAFKAAPKALRELGAEVFVLNERPDGININKNCGSTHMEELKEFVKKTGADAGLAFDGDADRVLAVDEEGNVVDGDQIMAILGLDLKKKGKLSKDTIVATVMSNLGLDMMAKKENINILKTKVGDRYVLECMLENGYVLGGEQSGHIIFLQHNTTGDGLLTGVQLLNVLKSSGKKLSELASVMQVLPQVLRNAKVKNEKKNSYLDDEVVSDMCKKLEEEFKGEGRVLVRASGTEPLIRVMIEGKDQEYITKKAEELAKVIEERLG
ncbi:MAG TPA: phosphoglucosamine mutase [Ruminiclostridium sp.]|uniref:phosphoglucosamine mutase n=1 Tax=Acetivibrio saccincola TaxID=1677857 RepID=UPI000C6DBF37|nr:phosphoglucosamine mutase [Acetivibrio saccincola]NLW26369.1 phosphoglucosamine mutase [Acetivibrio saccincola]HAA42564.1 phosphoglucosamine mutase [Ruminiclostridium sp.]HOA97130.1 phosphoglucosamine mutase [Acetivibrio saccincola]HQD27831.1 phosphoglucosamine mutase [Acetivibrio saccincola]